jgi:hypothetical protein
MGARYGAMRIEEKCKLLLCRNPSITFRLGDRFVNIIVDNELHRLSLKFNGSTNPALMDYKATFQYRTMTALGFVTKNGITYNYCDGEHDVWVRLWKSQVQAIKDNLELVSSVSYKPSQLELMRREG